MQITLLRAMDAAVVLAACVVMSVIVLEALREARNSPQKALALCWDDVADRLASPESAVMNEELSDAFGRKRRRNDPTLWRVHLVVDERDPQRGTIREYYQCEVEHYPSDNSWRILESSVIPE